MPRLGRGSGLNAVVCDDLYGREDIFNSWKRRIKVDGELIMWRFAETPSQIHNHSISDQRENQFL